MSDDEEPSLGALARAYVEALGMLYVPGLDKIAVQSFNALGALSWVVGVGLLGYTLGEIPWVKSHVQALVLALIIVPGLLAIWGTLKSQTQKKTSLH